MSLTGAWAKLQMQMEMDKIRAHYDTQQKILELHKSMWDKEDKINSVDMITIQNIGKIVGKKFHMRGNYLAIGTIHDVVEWIDNRYEFRIKVETPKDIYQYSLYLNRKKIPFSQVLHDEWGLYYEEKPNQLIVEELGKGDLRDMGEVIGKISNLMDRILTR